MAPSQASLAAKKDTFAHLNMHEGQLLLKLINGNGLGDIFSVISTKD